MTTPTYQIPLTNLIPPEGWKTQLKFQLTSAGRTTPLIMVQDFTYNLDITTSTGDGTITLALDDVAYLKLRDNDEFQIFWGWSKTGDLEFHELMSFPGYTAMKESQDVLDYIEKMNMDTEHIPVILTGYIKDVKRVGDTLVIDFFDKGVLLEALSSDLNYPSSLLSYIVEDIAFKAGITLVIDWAGDSDIDIMMTYPPATSTTGTSGSGATAPATPAPAASTTPPVTSANSTGSTGGDNCICLLDPRKTTGCPAYKSISYAGTGQKCWKNYCPVCGGVGTLIVSIKPGVDNKGNQITCSSVKCGGPHGGTDYCAKTGQEVSGSCDPNKVLTACGATDDSGTSSTTSGTSFWDALTGVLTQAKVDLMAFVHLDVLYVVKIPDSNKPPLMIDDRLNVVQGSVTQTDPKADKVNKIIVSYGNTAKKKTVYASYPDMILKYGVKPQELTEPKMNAEQATNYALKQLNMANRTDGFSIDCTILGAPFYYPSNWCHVILTKYGIDQVLFLIRYVLKFTADKIPTADLSLADYYPDLSVATSSSTDSVAATGTGNLSTITAIMAADDKYHDCQGAKYSYINANADYGCSNCWGNSYWLYQKLTAAGIQARIVCGNGGCKSNGAGHRWVQYNIGQGWVNMPYDNIHHYGQGSRTVDGILPHPEAGSGNGM
jgi:hypothetical protein